MGNKVPAGRIAVFVAASVGMGAIIGGIAAGIMAPFAAFFGVVGGAIVGLIVSPVIVVLLGRKPILRALALVLGPSIAAGVLGGFSLHPGVSLLAIVVYLGMAGVASVLLADAANLVPAGCCVRCGYEVKDLPKCPECGWDRGARAPESRTLPRRDRLVLAAVAAAGGLGLLGYAVYERHRVRSTAELVDQLGANDMQLQWEAQHELAKREPAALVKALDDPRVGVRRNAAWALEDVRDPTARPALKRLLNDPDPWTRDHAKRALERLPAE
jgi:hypothetical protein